MFLLAVAHWTHHVGALNHGLTVCAQPRRIFARELCNRVRESQDAANRKDNRISDRAGPLQG